MKGEVFMFYDEEQALRVCKENPILIFQLMKEGHFNLVDRFLSKNIVPLTILDEQGNTILMQLLKYHEYDLVLKYLKKKEIDINHQNNFAHYLISQNYLQVAKIIQELNKKKEFLPNIKNLKGETILDLSIEQNYFYTTVFILKDKRFNNIDLLSFGKLYQAYIKSNLYGRYTKLTNLEYIITYLNEKDFLLPKLQVLTSEIKEKMELIKEEILNNRSTLLDSMIRNAMEEV